MRTSPEPAGISLRFNSFALGLGVQDACRTEEAEEEEEDAYVAGAVRHRQLYAPDGRPEPRTCIRQHTSTFRSIRQHTNPHRSACFSTCQHTPAYGSSCRRQRAENIRQHTSAYVSIRQHTSAAVGARATNLSYPPS
jgi:hypothetical protein